MKHILIAGAGKIGSLIACMLMEAGDYQVTLVDVTFSGEDCQRLAQHFPQIDMHSLDVTEHDNFVGFIKQRDVSAVVSCLPYFFNEYVARAARTSDIHYFDLTEDNSATRAVKVLSKGAQSAFVPQCGLAPGFISIAANTIMQHFDELDQVKLRVGALPQNTNNALQYALTWSTDGVINEYGNSCYGIRHGEAVMFHPLEGLEHIQLDGQSYEAFNTSGGLGSLADIYQGRVKQMDYKTIRFPGHCEKMRVLMNELKLNEDRDTLKRILENAVPKTYQDMVIVYVSVTGHQNGSYIEENYVKKIYPQTIAELNWSAIQVTTASGACAVLDIVLSQTNHYNGLVLQENFTLDEFLRNRFGHYYQ